MNRSRRKRPVNLFLCALSVVPLCAAFALDTDQYQTLHVKSGSAIYDREQHIIIYEDKVQAEQGTSHLDGDKVIIHQFPDNKIKEMIAYGNPAHYNTIPSPNKNRLYVEALKITYNPNDKTVLLEGNGKVKQNGDSFSGPHIWYDMANGIVRSKITGNTGRTEVIIEPQQKTPSKQP